MSQDPQKYYALYSGGKDSAVMVDVLRQNKQLAGIVSLNTMTGSPELLDWLKKDPEVAIYETPVRYEWIVSRYGFARPGSHSWYFRYLKDRAAGIFVRDEEKRTGEKVVFATGVRRLESERRSRNTARADKIGGRPVAAPILELADEEIWLYIQKHNIPISPCYKTCHRALDCTCQAFGDPAERRILRIFEPEIVERNERLEDRLGGRWSNNDLPNIRGRTQSCLFGDCNQA